MTTPWFYNDVGEGELNNYSDKQNNLVLPGYIKCMLLNPSQGPSCNAPDTLSKRYVMNLSNNFSFQNRSKIEH